MDRKLSDAAKQRLINAELGHAPARGDQTEEELTKAGLLRGSNFRRPTESKNIFMTPKGYLWQQVLKGQHE